MKKTKDRKPVENGASLQKRILERGGQNLLFVMICFFLVGLAAPLLLVFLIKSPEADQHILIFGVSYYKLVFIYFLGAAIVVHTSLFFLRANLLTILFFFVLSLFSCFPLIVGLRNNLTLKQAIIDIPFFAHWPFFSKPAYILIEFLIPAGILVYLFLHIKSIFSKKPRTYAFLCAAAYLSIAAFFGFSGLIQAEEPNVVTALVRKEGDLVQKNVAAVLPGTSLQGFSPGNDDIQSSNSSALPMPEVVSGSEQDNAASKTRPAGTTRNPAPNDTGIAEIEQKMLVLSDKADRIIVELGQMKELFTELRQKPQEKKADTVVQKKEVSESRPATAKKEPPAGTKAITELQQEVRLLNDKTDRMLDALGRMASLLPERQENLQKDEAMAEEKEMDEPQGK
ncbi:MAG: hypothetical protein HWN68_15890 [Desulfobacterales bacterium]|nr:hypothetical protein [Desulfobacterales bacterium]